VQPRNHQERGGRESTIALMPAKGSDSLVITTNPNARHLTNEAVAGVRWARLTLEVPETRKQSLEGVGVSFDDGHRHAEPARTDSFDVAPRKRKQQ
jgi:hypothetical protein